MKESPNDEPRSAGSPRKRMDRVRDKWVDVERSIRQRMRIFPQKLRGVITARARQEQAINESDARVPPGGSEPSRNPETEQSQRKPIVSVHGRDLEEEETESEHPMAS